MGKTGVPSQGFISSLMKLDSNSLGLVLPHEVVLSLGGNDWYILATFAPHTPILN